MKVDEILKEYEYIREKMRFWDETRFKIITFTTTGWLLAFGLSEKININIEFIPILLVSILIIGAERTKVTSDQFIRCYTYIKIFIEPEVEGLFWETAHKKFTNKLHENKNIFIKIIKFIYYKLQYWLLWLFLITAYISMKYLPKFLEANNSYINFLYILILLVGHIFVLIFLFQIDNLLRNGHKKYVTLWKEVKRDLHKNKKCKS